MRTCARTRAWGACLFLPLAIVLPASSQPTTAPSYADWRSAVELSPLPAAELEGLEDRVAQQLGRLRGLVDEVSTLAFDSRQPPGPSRLRLADAYGNLASAYFLYGLFEVAAAGYENAVELDPADFGWRHLLGCLYRDTGQLERSAEVFLAVLERESYVPALIYYGEVLVQLQRPREAEAHFRHALQREPKSAAALAGMGQIALSQRRYSEAIAVFRQALEYLPAATKLHYPLALAYRGLGDIDQARAHMEARGEVGAKPNDPILDRVESLRTGERAYLLHGRLAHQVGRFEEAASAFEAALEASPNSVAALINLAAAKSAMGNPDTARVLLERAVDLRPDSSTAHFNLGVVLAELGDSVRASAHLEKAVELDANDRGARTRLVEEMRRLGQTSRALMHARELVRTEPLDPDARLLEANTLVAAGFFLEALESLEAALEALPDNGALAHTMARFLAAVPDSTLRDGARALDLAERVYAARPTAGHATTLALALAELGRCNEAHDWQRGAVEALEKAGALSTEEQSRLERYARERPCN